MSNYVELKKFFAKTLDPIHIGAGGYRLGRVDNTIIRDPATDVPKIPGTSVSGVIKEFYAIYLMEKDSECANKNDIEEKRKCSEKKVIPVFGDDKRKGTIRFYDGRIIFFPVPSIQGTIWITTKELLEYWFSEIKDTNGKPIIISENVTNKAFAIRGIDSGKPLNLGWLLLKSESISSDTEISLPAGVNEWVTRIVVVSDKLFSSIINDNLEVRTSVKIDQKTGTAEDGKLFTYEAIPRGTILGFEIAADKHRDNDNDNDISIDDLLKNVSPYFKLIGIGGMGTRGFGRLEFFLN